MSNVYVIRKKEHNYVPDFAKTDVKLCLRRAREELKFNIYSEKLLHIQGA